METKPMSGEEVVRAQYQKKEPFYFQLARQEMLPYIPAEACTVLDVGCGHGIFGKVLKETRAVEIWGVELDEPAAAIAAHQLDYVLSGRFDENLNLPVDKFDCILFNDVLEHMVDPYAALLYCKSLLRKDGVVVSSIPNVRYFETMWDLIVKKNWQYADYGILDRTHLRFFTYRSMLSTFQELGYQVQLIEGINSLENQQSRHSRRFKMINRLLFNWIQDMRYQQFVVVARPTPEN